jgi:hypothetical protein
MLSTAASLASLLLHISMICAVGYYSFVPHNSVTEGLVGRAKAFGTLAALYGVLFVLGYCLLDDKGPLQRHLRGKHTKLKG